MKQEIWLFDWDPQNRKKEGADLGWYLWQSKRVGWKSQLMRLIAGKIITGCPVMIPPGMAMGKFGIFTNKDVKKESD